MQKFLLLFLCSTIFVGCSPWHFSDSISQKQTKTVAVPFIQDDESGHLTSAVVSAVGKQPGFTVDDQGQYLLSISFLGQKDDKLGFRYDPKKLKKHKKDLILSECREKALVEVKLIDRFTNEVVLGPAHILGTIEYDHQDTVINSDINRFSLGQLCDIDSAEDVLYIPLYRNLAAKIALFLQNNQDFISLSETEDS